MLTEDYHYDLPERLIAQVPLKERDQCRLLHLDRKAKSLGHLVFSDICKLIKPGDRLVFNNTKVIPARIYGTKINGVPIEFLFTEKVNAVSWKVIAKPAKRLKIGTVVNINNYTGGHLVITGITDDGGRVVEFATNSADDIEMMLEHVGHFPLPPYIQREDTLEDRDDYQTVFARCKGAIAAPTAGLHFTDALIDKIRQIGASISFVTLHVGIGTFRPVKVDNPREHDIHEESFVLTDETATAINATKAAGGRIIAVGTTVVRVLEHCAMECKGDLYAMQGKTRLMILPPYKFLITDGLVTNFHLPKSTLLMLVSSFADRESVLDAYREAVLKEYRFFSYGDAMVIL
ncbi:MAG TPA: tRNA preQ1(34) S-adenosylmethionine ribosyltransferase-isomerase QueA [Chitinispirillaceae bacterium]|nr:tRNA preQ1(34) S-adenosylmethionine ribosyltransferase-isomerase QueA [Chitinispirillaceae bacterium]